MNYAFDSNVLRIIRTIISMDNISPINELSNEEGFDPIISNYSIPSYSVIEKYKRFIFIQNCQKPLNYFFEYPISFAYSSICIKKLIENKNAISPKLVGFYNRFILYSFLSWLQNYLRSNDDDEILNLMTCLLIFHDIKFWIKLHFLRILKLKK